MKNLRAIVFLLAVAGLYSGCEMFTSHGGEGQPCFIDTDECKPGLVCLDGTCVPGELDAGFDGGVDAGQDAGADPGQDAGEDAGADSGADDCKPESYQQCGADGNVHYFDSCGQVGDVAADCPDQNAVCLDLSGTEAECRCLYHWTGADCTDCPPNWDAAADCNACLPGWQDIDANDCGTCVRYVDGAAPPGGTGLSWEAAFQTIQGGIFSARNATEEVDGPQWCEVWVKAGTYNPPGTGDQATYQMYPKVHVYGGFSDTHEAWAERDWANNQTIMDGNGALHVITGSDDAVLDGFSVTGGWAETGGSTDDEGGGMKNIDASPVIRNCVFHNNHAKGFGGGISNQGNSSPIVTDCLFELNDADSGGGAIHNSGTGSVTITRCDFIDNESTKPTGSGDGGAIYNTSGTTVTIDSCNFEGNNAVYNGGAIYNSGAALTINQSSFIENHLPAGGGGSRGGALYAISASAVEVYKSILRGNSATDNGRGGAIYMEYSDLVMVNSVVAENLVEPAGNAFGGGLYLNNGTTSVMNCTIYGNSVDAYDFEGGGVYVHSGNTHEFVNTIIWGNQPDGIVNNTGAGYQVTYSDNQDGSGDPANSNISLEPKFVGGTPADLHLLSDSPCIDSATPNDAPGDDLEGVTRPKLEGYDMGAYEFH